ncbi:MAG: acetylxylan esterase [Clostridia bacterium]|nr:acetylxylan esterase [Clostridia bacterium]
MLKEKLAARGLPALLEMNDERPVKTPEAWRKRRAELLDMLGREEFGFTPAAPEKVTGEIEKSQDAFANKAVQQTVRLSFDTPGGPFSFPITLVAPKAVKPAPVFVAVSFRPEVPDAYLPAEEIIDHGFAIANIFYKDVTDDGPACDGLAALYPRDEKTGWGKIGMWAFAASRALDYLETREDIDACRACVIGHSRLGKTALWCGAQDERFSMVVSNDSGCAGAAVSRGKAGESVDRIAGVFPYWFCGNYQAWRGREAEAPFDQHMLLALVAPRKLYVNSAEEDTWADPESEFLGCVAASEAWTIQRVPGLVAPDEMPRVGEPLMDGGVCYHVRAGSHFLSRTDWLYHMACREKFGV